MSAAPPRVGLRLLRVGHCRHPEWVTIRGGRLGPIEFPALVALLLHPTAGPLLYDTGYAARFHDATTPFPERFYRWLTPIALPPAEHLLTQLAAHGVSVRDVSRVFVSHLHADHVGGLRDLPSARFTALEADVAAAHGSAWQTVRRGVLPALLPADFHARLDLADVQRVVSLGDAWAPFERGFDLLGDGSVVGIPLPGHAPAQLGLLLRTEDDEEVLLVADACWSRRAWQEQRLPSRLAAFIFDDWTRYRATLAGLGGLGARRPGLTMIPSHCAASFADWQRSHGVAG